jgi:hypothetical protein
MKRRLTLAALCVCAALIALFAAPTLKNTSVAAQSAALKLSQSAKTVEVYDFVELTLEGAPTAGNPFTDASVTGQFQRDGGEAVKVDGFCDAADGSVYRVRFMPSRAGGYAYTVKFNQGGKEQTFSGRFTAKDGKRRGPVRVDKNYPFHFVWEGTGEHYFWNGTTTYALMGWRDEAVIRQTIDRLAALKVNRIRVAIIPPRVAGGMQWYEPNVVTNERFTFRLNAWVAARPDSLDDPGHDVTRFNLPHWQKYERLLAHARAKDMIVSVIFYVDGRVKGVDPFGKARMGGEDEQRYYRYAAARLGAFSNVMWDVTNEYRLFRDDAWAEKMGAFLKECDPYDHLTSVHGHGDFRFMKSPWADYAMYQRWDEHGGNAFFVKARSEQEQTGRVVPQVNEEYGYEDHYPGPWGEGRKWPARNADSRRRLAWEMYMGGGYQTTGERADAGSGAGPDTGGGWINGRGDDTMVMLHGYARIVDFFTSIEWWKMAPRNDLVTSNKPDLPKKPDAPPGDGWPSANAMCLAEPGRQYVFYLPKGGSVSATLEPGQYRAEWFNPRTGKQTPLAGGAAGPSWTSPVAEDMGDWVLLLRR